MGKSKLGVVGGIVLILLGILFVIGFGFDPQDLITDAIFIAFGALLIRGAYSKPRKESFSNPTRQGSRSEEKRKNRADTSSA